MNIYLAGYQIKSNQIKSKRVRHDYTQHTLNQPLEIGTETRTTSIDSFVHEFKNVFSLKQSTRESLEKEKVKSQRLNFFYINKQNKSLNIHKQIRP